ncbi:hypothetical protein E2C01_072010 [Portunus trituberculatus]|uniref:Uncharacterized protein n=1 Tax=Portunus trituberculatus TaxID=210409 RepID=A0A5B7I5E7_PORTR|nr:hypothetical protein [Portunus trituberculatus]
MVLKGLKELKGRTSSSRLLGLEGLSLISCFRSSHQGPVAILLPPCSILFFISDYTPQDGPYLVDLRRLDQATGVTEYQGFL